MLNMFCFFLDSGMQWQSVSPQHWGRPPYLPGRRGGGVHQQHHPQLTGWATGHGEGGLERHAPPLGIPRHSQDGPLPPVNSHCRLTYRISHRIGSTVFGQCMFTLCALISLMHLIPPYCTFSNLICQSRSLLNQLELYVGTMKIYFIFLLVK